MKICYDRGLTFLLYILVSRLLIHCNGVALILLPYNYINNLCLWRHSLCSNLGGTDPEKLYRATLSDFIGLLSSKKLQLWQREVMTSPQVIPIFKNCIAFK